MTRWEGSSAIVTGAASGIGLALSRALLQRGAEVRLVDIDGEAARRAAAELGEHAHSVELDDRILDVNVRGVTNGVAAAYPLLREKGRGHLLNTCSAAGLIPIPLLTAYSMTASNSVSASPASP